MLPVMVLAVLGLGAGPATVAPGAAVVAAPVFAPVDRPGPALSVPAPVLAQSLQCTASATASSREVVLLVPGTTVTPKEDFGWNWFPALSRLGWPYCSVTLPDHAMSDAQVAAEYVVYAIREVHRISGHRVSILGHSQGGTEPRFALRFWPDLRPMVDDYIGVAATNHGSVAVDQMCTSSCAEALWQQRSHSRYTEAMNSYQETFPGIFYTNIYTHTDEFVQPNLDGSGTTSLHGGGGRITNVAIQDICPQDLTSEHVAIGTYDPVAYAIAIDALTHDGPADPARVSRAVCSEAFMPGVVPAQFPGAYGDTMNTIATELLTHSQVAAEPPLKGYTLAG
jgi:triacylglycerol esterase/lipase EstA (alpha/beta hydrolase family)